MEQTATEIANYVGAPLALFDPPSPAPKSKDTDERTTPYREFQALNGIFNFGFDVAATPENTKCDVFYTKEQNALLREWKGHGNVFCNPPYSRGQLEPWIRKAAYEAIVHRIKVVMVLPGDFSTRWWKVLRSTAHYILFCDHRWTFNNMKAGAKTPTVVAVFDYIPHPGDDFTLKSRLEKEVGGHAIIL